MAASFEKFNYLLRPNKSVERKMVCEMISGIAAINDLSSYQYIGFGSTYFADFSLFHRSFGINKMISIESVEHAERRCEFNKPYNCIELKMGHSYNILPNLDISKRDSIIWLDYDKQISDTVFSDINTVVTQMRPGSFFLLSINAEIKALQQPSEDGSTDAKKYLFELIGDERFPNEYLDKPINKKTYLEILYTCVIQQILTAVQKRNGMEDKKMVFRQTAHFEYRDGIRMITIGGFLLEEENADEQLAKMKIANLPFYRNGKDTFSIQCPVLSIKEIQALNAYLPCKPMDEESQMFEKEELNEFPVNNGDINDYASLYRYFPNFAETVL